MRNRILGMPQKQQSGRRIEIVGYTHSKQALGMIICKMTTLQYEGQADFSLPTAFVPSNYRENSTCRPFCCARDLLISYGAIKVNYHSLH